MINNGCQFIVSEPQCVEGDLWHIVEELDADITERQANLELLYITVQELGRTSMRGGRDKTL